ncbi:MAG: YchJ family protein [Cyanobacteria bacterium J06626_23]
MTTTAACPCGSQQPYAVCCEPYVTGTTPAPTAEALMRSRYTAYCVGNADYLFKTHHPSKRTFEARMQLAKSIKSTRWQGLTVLDTQKGQAMDETGVVEFVAIYSDPEPGQLHERSRFKRQNGRWFYLDGQLLPPLRPKRNDPCWCGSGKKYKVCHG